MNTKTLEKCAPWVLLIAVIVLWQVLCTGLNVSEFIFPSPLRIAEQLNEFKGIIAGHAWRTFWVTMSGFGLAIVVGVLPGFVWPRRIFTAEVRSGYRNIASPGLDSFA